MTTTHTTKEPRDDTPATSQIDSSTMTARKWIRRGIIAVGTGSAVMAVAVADLSFPNQTSAPALDTPAQLAEINTPATATAPAVRLENAALSALDVLETIEVTNERPEGYDRDLFDYPTLIDNGCDTRDTVLIRDSLTPAQVDPFGCGILAGDWYSVYDDRTWTDPGELQVDNTS